jgi:hypothetical protein
MKTCRVLFLVLAVAASGNPLLCAAEEEREGLTKLPRYEEYKHSLLVGSDNPLIRDGETTAVLWIHGLAKDGTMLAIQAFEQSFGVEGSAVKTRMKYGRFADEGVAADAIANQVRTVSAVFDAKPWQNARPVKEADEAFFSECGGQSGILLRCGDTCVLISTGGAGVAERQKVAAFFADLVISRLRAAKK